MYLSFLILDQAEHAKKLQKSIRPPIGILPRQLHLENRFFEIKDAMNRYLEANKEIPKVWVEEYNELCEKIRK